MSVRRGVALVVVSSLALMAAAVAWFVVHRPSLDAYVAHRHAGPPPPGAVTATWLGTSAVLLRDGDHGVLIDPFFTRPAGVMPLLRNAEIAPDETVIARWLARLAVTRLDAVAVSHSHYDHALDAAAVARRTGARLIGSRSTANVGRGGGLPEDRIVVAQPGRPVLAGPFRLTFIASAHAGASGGRPTGDISAPLAPPARYLDYRQGGTYSILVEHAQGTALHHGSAGFVTGALHGRRADVVFLGVALRPAWPPYFAETVDAVGARRVIPVHWDDFTRPLEVPLRALPGLVDLDAFFDYARGRPDISVRTLELGVPVAPFAP